MLIAVRRALADSSESFEFEAGCYATPGISWDRASGRGKPFHYFAVGAAVSEVEIDGRTGMLGLVNSCAFAVKVTRIRAVFDVAKTDDSNFHNFDLLGFLCLD